MTDTPLGAASWLPDVPNDVAERYRDSDWYRIGGAATIKVGVDRMYGWAQMNGEVWPYFDGRDVARIKRSFAALITQVFGGPNALPPEADLVQYLIDAHRDVKHARTGAPITRRVYYLIGRMFMAWMLLTDLASDRIDHYCRTYQSLESAVVPGVPQPG